MIRRLLSEKTRSTLLVARGQFGKLAITCVVASTFYGATGIKSVTAESIHDALVSAYNTNPALDAERARLRATDEEVPRARSGFRPNIVGNANSGYRATNTGNHTAGGILGSGNDGVSHPKGYSISLAQSIFSGFRTLNSVREAEATVEAGREDLRSVQQGILLEAATSYVDVIRDQAIVRLREGNVRVLSQDLNAANDRFDVGEVTKTDVAQARARRAGAVSALDLARSNLRSSRATYQRVVGHPPSRLRNPSSIMRLLPSSLPEAERVADSEHPTIMAAIFREIVAKHAIRRITGELLPDINLEASYDRGWHPSRAVHDTESTTVTGRLTMPFYQAGEVSARVRQAKHIRVQRRREIDQAGTEIREAAVTAWSRLSAARAQIRSDRTQVEANRVALSGVREEERVGQRTILDTLDAEQELLNSQVALETTRRDLVVAHYSVLSSIGRLTVYHLNLATMAYDPREHLDNVRHKWFGLRIEHGNGFVEHVDAQEVDGTAGSYK